MSDKIILFFWGFALVIAAFSVGYYFYDFIATCDGAVVRGLFLLECVELKRGW